ncbi:hypothetical protein Taro_050327 [Colocasia esculenta]|uniref:Uncharacterized protein n=1 Tax=Colocasia esculenta TaxID=4460 RepID=A0A843XD46_COLES|nr:hypothetical protein [Colocasia esculenta]
MKTEAAEAQPSSGLRRRHRPCRLQEGDRGEGDTGYVAFRPAGGSGDSSSRNLPEMGETLHTGEGSMLIMLETH